VNVATLSGKTIGKKWRRVYRFLNIKSRDRARSQGTNEDWQSVWKENIGGGEKGPYESRFVVSPSEIVKSTTSVCDR